MDNDESWRPTAGLQTLRARAGLIARIRGFFHARGVLEVETPMLSRAAVTDPLLASVPAQPFDDGRSWYLHTSPEFAMKRLLAAGSGPIFQLVRCFRRAESGPRHNPEFTMLEWYRPGFGLGELIAEVAELVDAIAPGLPLRRDGYRALFQQYVGVDPLLAPLESLRERALPLAPDAAHWDRDTLLDLLFAVLAEPQLGRACLQFVERFPASRASLARRTLDPDGQPVAERFELFVEGLELANGYDELCDAGELGLRFEADNDARKSAGLPPMPIDHHLLAAMRHGLPPSAGVALGVDRLLMVALGAQRIDEVIAFPAGRA